MHLRWTERLAHNAAREDVAGTPLADTVVGRAADEVSVLPGFGVTQLSSHRNMPTVIYDITLSPDGKLIATANLTGKALILEAEGK